jgi:ankyrin repeat protein
MQTETKPYTFEIVALTPEKASTLLFKELENRYPDLQVIENILAHSSVDVNAQNNNGNTVLMWSVNNEYENIVELLLNHPGIDVNVQNNTGQTALMGSARYGYEKCLKLLLNHPGINVNLQDKWGWTALMEAVAYGYEKSIEILLGHPGIDITLKTKDNRTIWDWAYLHIREQFPQLNPNA